MKTILLVDDDPVLLSCLRDLLLLCRYSVISKPAASEALSEVTGGASVDLVITDYRMSGIDGLEFLHKFRQLRPNVPVIVLTGFGTLDGYMKAQALGVTAFIQKPTGTRDLIRVVTGALGDSVQEVIDLGPENIAPAPRIGTKLRTEFIKGMGKQNDRFVIILDIDKLFSADDLAVVTDRQAGTTMVLKLPLTLAIIDGFLTKAGAERYVFPLSMVEECVELNNAGSATGNDKHMINVRGHIVPYVRLREQFAITGTPPSIEQIVIARVDDKLVGFVVDHVIGGHQTVIKNLGAFYRDVEGLSGATILGDGTVALILDVPRLIQLAEQEEVALCRGTGLIIRW